MALFPMDYLTSCACWVWFVHSHLRTSNVLHKMWSSLSSLTCPSLWKATLLHSNESGTLTRPFKLEPQHRLHRWMMAIKLTSFLNTLNLALSS
jgi:hypothetical protein